jgi:transcriptional regulator with XRE-family HTH domain
MPTGKQQEAGRFARAQSAEVRAALARQQMTIKELALRAGLSPSYLGKRLRNEASLTLNDLEAVCGALNEDIETFIVTALAAARKARERQD